MGRTLLRPTTRHLAALLLVLCTGGCVPRRSAQLSQAAQFQIMIRELLDEQQTTPRYHEMISRVQDMGPEVDAVLLALARDRGVNAVIRSNALVLLAERHATG